MIRKQRDRLVDALLFIPSVRNNDTRNDIGDGLPLDIWKNWNRQSAPGPDVDQLLLASANYPKGVEKMLDAIRSYEGDESIPFQEARQLWKRIQAHQQLCTRVEAHLPDAELVRELYGKSLPRGRDATPSIESLPEILDDLDRLATGSTGIHPLLAFVERLAVYVEQDTIATALQKWNDQAIQSLYPDVDSTKLKAMRQKLASDKEQHAAGHLDSCYALVELRPHPDNRNRPQQPKFFCEVVFWSEAGQRRHWCEDDEVLSLAQIPEKLAKIFRANAAPTNMIIEFLLPDELVCHDVDQWDDRTLRTQGIKVGMNYPVVVRLLTRMIDPFFRERCRHRWELLQTFRYHQAQDHLHWLCGHEQIDARKLFFKLKNEAHITCIGLTFMPDTIEQNDGILDALLDAGLPIAFWPRFDTTDVDCHVSLHEELQQLLATKLLHTLPHDLCNIRQQAYTQPEDDLGHHLTLMWDDPTRILPKYDDDTDPLYEQEMI